MNAIEGFELDILDYLLKPITFHRFYKAAQKAKQYFALIEDQNSLDYIFVKVNKRLEKVLFEEILFLESQQNYVQIYTTEKKLFVHSTLKALAASLPQKEFIQSHKSYIVAKNKIQAIEGNLLIIGAHKIPISKYLKPAVLEAIT